MVYIIFWTIVTCIYVVFGQPDSDERNIVSLVYFLVAVLPSANAYRKKVNLLKERAAKIKEVDSEPILREGLLGGLSPSYIKRMVCNKNPKLSGERKGAIIYLMISICLFASTIIILQIIGGGE